MSVPRRRDAPLRAVARRRPASVCVAAALVLLCAVASAGTGLGGSVAALDDSTGVTGQAPDWPFRGIVRNVADEFVACGASSAATAFIAPREPPPGDPVLPDPALAGTYLECGPPLDLQGLPFTPARKLVRW